jgi:hypothetical protein
MAALAALALAWAACAHPARPQVRYTETTPAPAQTRRAPEDIAIFALAPPPREHVNAGVLEARVSHSNDAPRQDMLAALRARAAEVGCDALVLTGPWYETVTHQPVYRRIVTESHPVHRATCIVYRAPATSEPAGGASE